MTDADRPLELGPLLDDVGGVLRERMLPYALVAAVLTAPAVFLEHFWQSGHWQAFGIAFLPAKLIDFIGSQLITAGLIHATARHLAGKRSTFQTNIASGWKSLWAAIWTGFLMGLVVFLGFLALVVPGFVFLVRYFVAVPAAVVEGRPGLAALRRSKEITSGHGWTLFGIFLLYFLASVVLGAMVGAVAGAGGSLLAIIGGWAVAAVLLPVAAVFSTVVYWRLRSAHDLREAVQSRFG